MAIGIGHPETCCACRTSRRSSSAMAFHLDLEVFLGWDGNWLCSVCADSLTQALSALRS